MDRWGGIGPLAAIDGVGSMVVQKDRWFQAGAGTGTEAGNMTDRPGRHVRARDGGLDRILEEDLMNVRRRNCSGFPSTMGLLHQPTRDPFPWRF